MHPSAEGIWLERSVPRHAGYPPVSAFHKGVTDDDYADSLADLAPDDAVSLYAHVPYCRKQCLYCGCHTTVTHRDERIERYLESVKQEILLLAAVAETPHRISSLRFGGGSPNILSSAMMEDVFSTLAKYFDFSECSEIAMELDPRLITRDQARQLATLGVTRVSLGVQDFQADVQQAIGREQPYAMVEERYDWLRSARIKSVDIDLMYGLPLQSPTSLADTARQVALLAPDRIALFPYVHMPQSKKHQQALEDCGLPDGHQLPAMDRAARDVFVSAGYAEIGVDHFAMRDDGLTHALAEKRLRRNFHGYTDDMAATLIGVGASSISRTPDGYFQNERDIELYQDMLSLGILPTVRGVALSDDDRLRADIIESLICYMDVDINALCDFHGLSPDVLMDELDELELLEAAGIIVAEGPSIRVAPAHRMATGAVCHIFDKHSAVKSDNRAAAESNAA